MCTEPVKDSPTGEKTDCVAMNSQLNMFSGLLDKTQKMKKGVQDFKVLSDTRVIGVWKS
jgi:hypothetical protein